MNIGETISKAIKESKWLNISYLNKDGEITFFWVSVLDINHRNKTLKVSLFNDKKSLTSLNGWINFENIKSAQIIEFSSYEIPIALLEKIENNLDKFEWLNYDKFNHNILNYYAECNYLDADPCQDDYTLIPGIDLNILLKNKRFSLNDEQMKKFINDIYRYDIKNTSSSYYTLAINHLSIDESKKKYVVCYYKLSFNPNKKELVLDNNLRFNQSFLIDGRKHSLFNYINMDVDDFVMNYESNYREFQKIIQSNLFDNQIINTRPEIMLIKREVPVKLSDTFDIIQRKYEENTLPTPLKSFFGNITKRNNLKRKEPDIILYDKKININQMRVLYNSMKFPVTYVQGPPGTGKTQTIINVILSGFYNDKTILVCSSNNKPVNGIVDLVKFEYNGEKVQFPYLRLGNINDVKKATLRIKELYDYTTNKNPKEELLSRIKTSENNQNAKLIELLNIQERKIDIEDCLESSKKLLESIKNTDSKIINTIRDKVQELQSELDKLPEITNEQIVSLFNPLTENYQLSQFLFFKSLQYIQKLKKPRFSELIRICSIEDDDTRAMEFNKWTSIDDNMKILTSAFPIIFSTNISSNRLGSPNFMFDLVIMDEAGQCNVATALIPITKANSLLLIGDPNQLRPVIILEEHVNIQLKEKYHISNVYDYKHKSILDVMLENDNISKYILLKYHYRCGKKIINFSNQRYYNNSLNLTNLTREGELEVLDIKNINTKDRNEAWEEAQEIVNYIERNKLDSVFIITPFVNQKILINNLLSQKNITNVECGTIHSLQGAEKDTIIFSPAISHKTSKKTFAWIKDNFELINVAVTRAKNKLIIASDTEVVAKLSDKTDDLYSLIQYAANNGKISVPPNENVRIEIGKSNGSKAEDEFYKTISHFCSCNKQFEAERNVKLSKLFDEFKYIDSKMEFDVVLYEKKFWNKKPAIAIEVNGGEHLGLISREKSDRLKMQICKDKNIKLLFIPNSFVKSYEYIIDIIMSSKNKNISIQQTMFDE